MHSCVENRKSLLRICPFLFVYFLCVEISILKIVLSHAHNPMSFSKKIIFSLVMRSTGGPDMVNG